MPPFLLSAEPVTSIDAYLATDAGGSGIERAQKLGPAATIEVVLRSGLRSRGGGVTRPAGSGRVSRFRPVTAASWCAMAPKVSRARSRTGRWCGPIPTSSSRV